MMRRFRSGLLVSTAAALLGAGATCATAGAATSGHVAVSIRTPKGVPANVMLQGQHRRLVAAKPTRGNRRRIKMKVPAGRYAVHTQQVSYGGDLYGGRADRRRVQVRKHRTARVDVRYRRLPSAKRLRVTKIRSTSVSLAWSAPKRMRVVLRRAAGANAPTRRTRGKAVAVHGRTAVDRHLKPGKQYSYALFTRYRGKHWSGPITLVAGTAPRPGSSTAAFITAPTTVLAKRGDIASERATGSGVSVRLDRGGAPPVIGSVVVLPQSRALPGGYLGRVTSIAADGTAHLSAVGLSDAFDYYRLSIPDFKDPLTALRPRGATASSLHRPGDRHLSSALGSCPGASGSKAITFSPSLGLGGHFSVAIDKFHIFGKSIPKGASLDMAFSVTATDAMGVNSSGALKCSAPFKSLMRTLTTSPVPIAFYFSPTAEASVNGAADISNVGVTATAGFKLAGSFGIKHGASFSGGPILSAGALKPQGTLSASLGATLGGQVVVGPGAGTADAGVVAGVGGELNPIDASFGAVFPVGDSRHNACLKAEAAFTRELNLTAKAWLGDWDISKSVTFGWLRGETNYFGSPWYLPGNCASLPPAKPQPNPKPNPKPTPPPNPKPTPPPTPTKPGDSVLGPGVDKVDDSTIGSPGQVGHVDGFAPGSSTWVLSTGNIQDATGTPDVFASTDMGMPGDDDLSAFAGYQTSDAAGYQVELVPHGHTLHVRYVFASEEYPEYVGSEYNDVMEILVNGQNCATVPGTSDPVSVNTVNADANSAYYVDNSSGAAGYSTSMDGLTVPLTCSVPVTPGSHVTVKIAVADSSDAIFDSAVALLDQGIWSD